MELSSTSNPVEDMCATVSKFQSARIGVERKNIESMADRFGHSRLPLQAFIGWDAWDDAPLRSALRSQVKRHLGQGDGVLVFDPSGFAKSGRESGGVARQWGGRLGKVDNCQVAMYLGGVSRQGP